MDDNDEEDDEGDSCCCIMSCADRGFFLEYVRR